VECRDKEKEKMDKISWLLNWLGSALVQSKKLNPSHEIGPTR